MGKFQKNVASAVKNIIGSTFWVKATVTSSAIVTTPTAITTVSSGGELMVEDIVIKADSIGLAAGTTFMIVSDNAKGTTAVFLTKVAYLGANKAANFASEFQRSVNESATLTVGVFNSPVALELGKKLSVVSTGAACTGAGTVDIHIKFRRLSDTANIKAA